jgi:hypothetical protein
MPPCERLEALLADALAIRDERGAAALDAFLREHENDREALERCLARCRGLGPLGVPSPPGQPSAPIAALPPGGDQVAVSPPSTSSASREMPR